MITTKQAKHFMIICLKILYNEYTLILSVHQPNYFPYPGFFHKIKQSDIFVVLDNVQYAKGSNRNKIIVNNGWTWITVPINKLHKFSRNLEVEINNEIDWRSLHWAKISFSYTNAKYFHLYKEYFEKLYNRNWKMLSELNFKTAKKIVEWLGIKTEFVIESELKVKGKSTERIINLCKTLGADTYLSGIGGKRYLNEKLFENNNIKLVYQNYLPTPYKQHLSDSFIPNLSIIDLLANMGPNSMNVIEGKQTK